MMMTLAKAFSPAKICNQFKTLDPKSINTEESAALGSCGIQEKTWQAKDELERCGKEGPPKNGIKLGRGQSISPRQTFVVSTCGPMHR